MDTPPYTYIYTRTCVHMCLHACTHIIQANMNKHLYIVMRNKGEKREKKLQLK